MSIRGIGITHLPQPLTKFILVFGVPLIMGLSSLPALAQRPPSDVGADGGTSGPTINPEDYFEFVDQNGVDLSNGQILHSFSIDGGAAGYLSFRRGFNWDVWIEKRE